MRQRLFGATLTLFCILLSLIVLTSDLPRTSGSTSPPHSMALAVTDKVGKLPQPASVIEEIKQGTNGTFSHQGSLTRFDIDWDTPNDRDEVVTAPASGTAYIHHDSDDFGNHVNIDAGPADPNNPNGPRHFWVMAHNKTFLISDGQHVEMGQPIAMDGCTGNPCDGDHIHFGLHQGNPQQNVIFSPSVDNALISSRDVTAGQTSFSLRRTTEFVTNRHYESDNAYPSHTLTDTDWHFDNDSSFWHLGPNGGAVTIGFNSPGAWILRVNNDPSIVSPLLNIQASSFSALEITMASQASDTLGAVYFATESSPNFSGDKVFTFTVIPGGGYHTIRVPLTGKDDLWKGRITRLRVDPVGNASGQAVGIQRIRMIGDVGGAQDELSPLLAVTSHSDGQTVSTSAVGLSGTATDDGRGSSGISSVTVNGNRANGDTANGSGVANWSVNLPLNVGSNSIVVRARDSSPAQNMTQQTLTIIRSAGSNLSSPTANAATSILNNGFTGNWTTSNGATGYLLDVSTNSSFSSFVSGYQNLDVGNSLSRPVTGLIASTLYYYRVRAYNASGTSANSNTVNVSTTGPMIFLEQGTVNRAAAIDSITWLRGPFRVINLFSFTSDNRTRVMLFTSDLGLTQPDPSVLTVTAGGFNLPVESVGPVLGVSGMNASYIIVRLPDLPTGDLPLIVTLRGVPSSNSPTLPIASSGP